jgi:fluoroacetyl-CoA thioesterase
MREIFQKGSCKIYEKRVSALDLATFESGTVHEVYSTFALTRDAEWSGRLFVLEMKEEDEEGIGTQINLKHLAPAFVGELLTFTAFFDEIKQQRGNHYFFFSSMRRSISGYRHTRAENS